RLLLIESVPPEDPMFRHLARGRELLYGDCATLTFEKELQERFSVVERLGLPNGRRLYLAERK
ncbi:MAG TPA: methyltransferase type 12, partial [Thermoanaerobaculia bacterium]|nr:methyltransferase type 12 [Thermoanaerobaculia bacterium]